MNHEEQLAWLEKIPLIRKLKELEEVFWLNPKLTTTEKGIVESGVKPGAMLEAEERLRRFAPYIELAFPETKKTGGIIESPLIAIPEMKKTLERLYETKISGELLIKGDHALPISGSIKARGGIYEVLKHAEDLALRSGLLTIEDNYAKFANPEFQELFGRHSIVVGSTGNLGLSIGIMSAKLGFKVTVHMSADAKQWKKAMLREKGVQVIEYADDYSKAVEEGRRQAEGNPYAHFIDDENSLDLFLGYAVAASRLKDQLLARGTVVDGYHPLFVYLPCGVGGGPGGVAYGLKLVFGDHVHCFFAEPTHSPCMLLGMATGLHEKVSVQDFGIDNKTEADGLAVGRPSGFVGKAIEPLLSGSYTISDQQMFRLLKELVDSENIRLEPSALAGMIGAVKVLKDGRDYDGNLNMSKATHIVWATGGSMVPIEEQDSYYLKAEQIVTILQ